ncbi:hypothetical protein J6590_046204 [Homalodisca vitripennis]|nr:hypothetical protein J6590_046204 [Homalodisca vitripennis]
MQLHLFRRLYPLSVKSVGWLFITDVTGWPLLLTVLSKLDLQVSWDTLEGYERSEMTRMGSASQGETVVRRLGKLNRGGKQGALYSDYYEEEKEESLGPQQRSISLWLASQFVTLGDPGSILGSDNTFLYADKYQIKSKLTNLQIISTLDNDMYRAIIALNGLCYLSPARRSRTVTVLGSVSADCTARNRSRRRDNHYTTEPAELAGRLINTSSPRCGSRKVICVHFSFSKEVQCLESDGTSDFTPRTWSHIHLKRSKKQRLISNAALKEGWNGAKPNIPINSTLPTIATL